MAGTAQSLFVPSGINYVDIGDLDVTGDQITVEAIITKTGNGINIVSKHTGPGNVNYLMRPGSAEITTTNGYINAVTGFNLVNGECYHLAFTYDGTSLDYYVNGCLASSTPHTGNLVTNDYNTGIGDMTNCQCESWVGYIDEVRIWNVARTQTEIQANMTNLPNPTTQPGLLAYYQFNGNYLNAQGNPTWNGTPIGNPQLQNNSACQNVDLSFQNQVITTDVSCVGSTDGSVTIVSSGGHPNYTYSPDGINYFPINTIGNLPPGNATVWASSGANSGCVEQIPITISEPGPITTSITGTDPNCVGGNDGTADLSVNGGTPPYSYSWSSGSTQEDPNNLSPGNNSVTVTDANGCTATDNVVLGSPSMITTSISGTNPTCYGGNNGTADLVVQGGTAPYTFVWSNGSTVEDPQNLTPGQTLVTISDANGCTASESILLDQPTPVLPNAFANYVSTVGACDGGGTANPAGGTPPYTYLWDNGQTTQTATGMCVGVHSVTVTDANGCTGFQNITVNVPACLTDVDFYTWQQAGQPANGNWIVENGGAQVRQTINGSPTFFVTPVDYINVRMKGKMSTTDNDDDWMGVVFGFQDPLGASDYFDMWLFDWKQAAQGSALEGMTLNRALGTITNYGPTFNNHTNTPEFTVVATNYGNNGWITNFDHEIEVTYTVNRAIILVDGDTIFDVYDCFEPGRFGFYNYSQREVIYSDFTYELFADFVVEEPQICALDTAHFTFLEQCGNSNNLAQFAELQWNYGDGNTETFTNLTLNNVNPTHIYQSGGIYQVQLIAKDTLGCRDTILKNIQVFDLPTAEFTYADQCLLDNTQFTDVSTPGDFPIFGQAWLIDGNQVIQQNPTYQFPSPGPYLVGLGVQDSFGCQDTVTHIVQIHELPQADFTPIDDCYSANYPFQDQSTIGTGTVDSWQWDFGDNGTAATQNPTHTYATFGQYDVTLIALSDQGCGDTITQTIVLHDNPVPGFEIPHICQLEPMQFTDTASIQEGSIVSWNYTFGDGNSSADQHPFHTYLTDGSVDITQTVTSDFGCETSVTVPAIVDPKPGADFVTQNECLNDLMTFADASTIASGSVVSWEWDFGDSNTDVAQNTSNLYSTAGNYTVELMVESDNGCRDTTEQQVEVYQLPVAAFAFNNVCLDASATFTDQSTSNSGTIDTWNWGLGEGTLESGQGPIVHDYPAPADYDVELVVETDLGCFDTLVQTITIHPMPEADFVVDSVCFGLPTNFTDLTTILSGSINNYAWNFGFGSSSSQQNPSNVFPQTGYHSVFLTVTSDFGCKDTITKDIRVYVLPEPEFSHNDTCYADNVNFVNISTISEETIDLYDWDFGDANTSTLSDPIHGYNSHGFYQAQLIATSNYGCIDSVSHEVEIYPLPNVSFVPIPEAGCQPLTVVFDNESSIENGYFISGYEWDLGIGQISTEVNPQTVYADTGFYDVQLIVTSTQGCDDTLQLDNAVEVWPRPVAQFSTDKEEYLMFFPTVQFIDESVGATQWDYDFADGSYSYDQNPSYTYEEAGNYQVIQHVENDYGCDDEFSQRVIIKPAITLYIPNTFTPNNDGMNEVFRGEGVGLKEYNMWIFDRWGENLFYSATMDEGWDGSYKGKQVEAGMYVYRFTVIDVKNEYHEFTGEVYLMR
ncbi:MAG: PKD domain-containing protein [Flavobacteriales bacterium]|nr:PKD domain-containing protein [Flavobacteriales bacterium]